MRRDDDGPIMESRFEQSQRKSNKGVLIVVAFLILTMGLAFFLYVEEGDRQEVLMLEAMEEQMIDQLEDELIELENGPATVEIVTEEGTADFFYQRALQKEEERDYNGAVEDYTRTIELAEKYSAEMWNALNNRGIIKSQQLEDYRGAMKDFSKIISIETNRYDGEVNDTRLEAGYTNRAFVKKMLGDKDGACDDLYEALSLGVDATAAFIEKQIDKNCL